MTSYLLRGGLVVDGTGQPGFIGDVRISNDVITHVGHDLDLLAPDCIEIPCDGKIVSPGFIDMHSHSDIALFGDPFALSKVSQGVTLEVLGQDGLSYAPSSPRTRNTLETLLKPWNGKSLPDSGEIFTSTRTYLHSLDKKAAVNFAYLTPHGNLRLLAMENPGLPATKSELAAMKSLLAQSLSEGSVGLSAGLVYYPSQFAELDELIALAEVVAENGGYFAPHHRNYGPEAFESYSEMFAVSLASGCRLHLTHANLSFPMNKGRAQEMLVAFDHFEQSGGRLTFDNYPYSAGATSLFQLFPTWFKSQVLAVGREVFNDQPTVERLIRDLDVAGSDSFHGLTVDWSRILVSSVKTESFNPEVGRTIQEIADLRRVRASQIAIELLVNNDLEVSVVTFFGNQENIDAFMLDPRQCIGTDGLLAGERPHPRAYGAFSKYLRNYVFENKLLTVEEGIRKITSLPASVIGATDRGVIAPGFKADLCVFDGSSVQDASTFEDPRKVSKGFEYVFVNGLPVLNAGVRTTNTPGVSVCPTRG